MAWLLYVLGSFVLISGLAAIATALGAAPGYVLAGAAVLFVAALSTTVAGTRNAA